MIGSYTVNFISIKLMTLISTYYFVQYYTNINYPTHCLFLLLGIFFSKQCLNICLDYKNKYFAQNGSKAVKNENFDYQY